MNREATNPVLQKALALTRDYSCATKAHATIHDHNYLPIPEMSEKVLSKKNICIYCIKHQKNMDVESIEDLNHCPCKEMHASSLKESHQYGGSYSYECPLGLHFWTSPIYLDEHFIGALMGSGFLGKDREEVSDKMYSMGKGKVSKSEIDELLEPYEEAKSQKIKALSELMLIMAQSLSVRSKNSYTAMRRRSIQQLELSSRIEELNHRHPPGSSRPDYPVQKEQKLLDSLRQGDIISAKQILNELLAILIFNSPGDFKSIQYRAIELTVLLSRVDASPNLNAGTTFETNNSSFKAIQDAIDIESLTDALHRIIEDVASQINSFQGIHHPSALKKAEIFILDNFTRKISLEEIAKSSGFSAPYFSTIFKEEMGENLSSYLNRLRVEKAKIMINETNMALSKIARTCGFEDQSWFSKIFKHYTGISPGKFRKRQ